ncbi:MAG: hypothetical protein FWC26_11885 [Fibromonadales bacterium]|nr:hypothetical protein [Fibromonadales bacterium]
MQLSVQEFTKSPQAVFSAISKRGRVILTRGGKPSFFLVKTNDKNFEMMEEMLQDMEFMQNMKEMQAISKKNGNSKMSMKQINTLIADVRKSKKAQA